MTAYGRGEYALGKEIYTAELKSLNNRYRDVVLRLPNSLQGLEEEIKSQISSKVKRGRVEVSLQVEKKSEETTYNLELNLPLIKSYLKIYRQLNEELDLDKKINPEYLLQLKDVIVLKPEEVDLDRVKEGVREVLEIALDSLDNMKIREGKAIEEDFLKRLSLIEGYTDSIEKRSPLVVKDYQDRLKDRIDMISEDIEMDEGRLLQEVAIFANRCDITEEVVRLRSHIHQFRNYLSGNDSVGRRLDFLTQEINREINTISSKASDSSISANAIEVKAELEKLKEQIQNVE
jgi:uncharacterized protein (TIGR00255 family)